MGSRRNASKGSVSDLSMEDIKEALLPSIRSAINADIEEIFKTLLGDRLEMDRGETWRTCPVKAGGHRSSQVDRGHQGEDGGSPRGHHSCTG